MEFSVSVLTLKVPLRAKNELLQNSKELQIQDKQAIAKNRHVQQRRGTLFYKDEEVGKGCFKSKSDGTPLQYSCLENPMDGGAW